MELISKLKTDFLKIKELEKFNQTNKFKWIMNNKSLV